MDAICNKVETMKNNEYLTHHPYKIWSNTDSTKWYTYVFDDIKDKRRLIKRNKKEDIDKFLIDFYKKQEARNQIITIHDYFPVWIERQKQCGRGDSTIKKYYSDYKRFFEKDEQIDKIDITKITEIDIEEYIFRLLDRLVLKKQAFSQMFHMLNGILEKARKDRIIYENPCSHVDISIYTQRCKKQEFDQNKRVLNEDECKKLMDILKKDRYMRPNYIPSYAIELALLTGMRAGELAFLKWDHIKTKEGYIEICGSEKLNQKTYEYYDSETKTQKTRRIPLTVEMKDFFKNLKLVQMKYGYLGEYVFTDHRGRIHRGTLCSCARNKCSQAGLNAKGLQVARRTFNSQLRTQGVSTVIAASILGHSEEVNNKFYTYDVSSMEHKKDIVENINKNLCVNKKR